MSKRDNSNGASSNGLHRPFMHIGTQEADDPSLYEESSLPWDVLATPMDGGIFGHRRRYLLTPSITIYQEEFDSRVRVRGLTPDGKLVFSIPLRLGSHSLYWKAAPSSLKIPASLPGSVDAHIDAGQNHLMILLDTSLVQRELPPQRAAALLRAATARHISASPAAIKHLGRWLSQLLDQAHHSPDMLQHQSQLRTLEEELLHRLGSLLNTSPGLVNKECTSLRWQGFHRAIEFMRESNPSTLSVSKLCDVSNVSQRTLEYAFCEKFDMTPMGYIRLHRFHAVRRALKMAQHGQATIAEIAAKSGFYEMGRFASQYKRIFHELPSQTMAASPVDTEGAVDLNWRGSCQ